jgi:hypothetical protein
MGDFTGELTGELVAGRFHVGQRIGKGGYGEVYLAEQVSMGRRVALKILSMDLADDPRVIERFYREARQTSQLTHTNTVVCYDFGEDRALQVLYLAMEYLNGCSLLDVLGGEGALSPMRTLGIVEQIAASLSEAHERGIIHRDLKPANIMLVSREGNTSFVKVIDFGIAMIFNQAQQEQQADNPRLTRSGMVMGTPHYMAPEQIKHQPLDHRVDVYALGVLTFEMLIGKRPFVGATPIEIMRKHLEAQPPLLHEVSPHLPPSLSALISWAMAKRPGDRPQSVVEFANAFRDALLQGEDNTARVGAEDARSLQHLLQAALASRSGAQGAAGAPRGAAALTAQHEPPEDDDTQQGARDVESGVEPTSQMSFDDVRALMRQQESTEGPTAHMSLAAVEEVMHQQAPTAHMSLADVEEVMRERAAAAAGGVAGADEPGMNSTTDIQAIAISGAHAAPAASVRAHVRDIPPTSQTLPVPVISTTTQPKGSGRVLWALVAAALIGALIALGVAVL